MHQNLHNLFSISDKVPVSLIPDNSQDGARVGQLLVKYNGTWGAVCDPSRMWMVRFSDFKLLRSITYYM